jgi:hypothetical protein
MAYHYENDSMEKLTAFVDSVLQQPFPGPGESFLVSLKKDNGLASFQFTRPNDSDSLLEHVGPLGGRGDRLVALQ